MIFWILCIFFISFVLVLYKGGRAIDFRKVRGIRYFGDRYILILGGLIWVSLLFTWVLSTYGDPSLYLMKYYLFDQSLDNLGEVLLRVCIFLLMIWISYHSLTFFASQNTRKVATSSVEQGANERILLCLGFFVLISCAIALYSAMKGVSIHSEDSLDFGGPFKSLISIVSRFYIQAPALIFPLVFAMRKRRSPAFKQGMALIFVCISVGVFIALKTAVKQGIIMPPLYTLVGAFVAGVNIKKKYIAAFLILVVASLVLIQGARIQEGKALKDVKIGETVKRSIDYTKQERATTSYLLYAASRANIYMPIAQAVNSEIAELKMPIKSWLNPVLFWLPSFVYAQKPEPFDQNEFGRFTGIADYSQDLTVVRPTHIGEIIITFGFWGTVGVGILLGSTFAIAERFASSAASISTGATRVVVAAAWASFVDVEGPLSYAMGGFLKLCVIVGLVLIWVRFQPRSKMYSKSVKNR